MRQHSTNENLRTKEWVEGKCAITNEPCKAMDICWWFFFWGSLLLLCGVKCHFSKNQKCFDNPFNLAKFCFYYFFFIDEWCRNSVNAFECNSNTDSKRTFSYFKFATFHSTNVSWWFGQPLTIEMEPFTMKYLAFKPFCISVEMLHGSIYYFQDNVIKAKTFAGMSETCSCHIWVIFHSVNGWILGTRILMNRMQYTYNRYVPRWWINTIWCVRWIW